MKGRPFRFLAGTLGGWALVRVAALWPTIGPVPVLVEAIVPAADATAFTAVTPPVERSRSAPAAVARPRSTPIEPVAASPAAVVPPVADLPAQPPPLRLPPLAAAPIPAGDRFALSLWAVARRGFGDPRPGSQLGGSQAGLRATYALGRSRQVALAARLSGAIEGAGREAAVGIDWQPAGRALHLIAEQRIALDRAGRGGPAAFAVAGLDPTPVAAGFRLEAYGQAGAVLRDRLDPFADAAARLTRPVATAGRVRLDLGVGGWAGAQRGAARLDVGPSAALVMPLGPHAVRLTLDWRQRIAGGAAPGSGPALSIGTDL